MKKVLKVFICMFMISLGFLISEVILKVNAETVDIKGVEYTFELSEDGTYYIMTDVDIDSSLGSITIPSKYNGLPIKEIKGDAKFSNWNIKSYYFEGTFTDWCNISFENAGNNPCFHSGDIYMLNKTGDYELLTEINIPDGTTKISKYQFCGFYDNLNKIILPKSLKSIGESAFNGLGKCDVYYQGTIEDWLKIDFSNASANPLYSSGYRLYVKNSLNEYHIVTDITIPSDITEVSVVNFIGLNDVVNLTIPKSVVKFEKNFGYELDELKNVYYEGTIEDWCNITFEDNSNPMGYGDNFYLKTGSYYYKPTDLVIPNTVKIINQYQFYGFSQIEKITISSGVTEIKQYAFTNCTKVKEISLPNTLTMVGRSAFYDCDNLSMLVFPEGVKTIDSNAFGNCTKLKTVYLPSTLEKIDNSYVPATTLYYNGTVDKWLEVDDRITGSYVKELYCLDSKGVYQSTSNLVIPEGVTSIKASAFDYCQWIKTVTLPSSLVSIDKNAFYESSFITDVYYEGTIDDWFNLTIDVGGNPVEWADNIHFKDENGEYQKVVNLVIPEGITEIKGPGVSYFYNLKSITLPKSLKKIDGKVFLYCSNLETVYYNGTIEDWCAIELGITPMGFAEEFYFLNNGTYEKVTEIEIPESVKNIGKYQFYGFYDVKCVTISSNVESIGEKAFAYMTDLVKVVFKKNNNSVKIDSYAFASQNLIDVYYDGTIEDWCKIEFDDYYSNPLYYAKYFFMKDQMNEYYEVTELEIPKTVTNIGDYQFYGFDYLKKVTIPSGITSIDDGAFCNSGNLREIIFEDVNSLEYLSESAFYNCNKLENVYINKYSEKWASLIGFTYLNSSTINVYFKNDQGEYITKNEIIIPNGVEEIKEREFANAEKLEKIVISNSVKKISKGAFYNNISLKDVYYNGTIEEWCNITFEDYMANPMSYAEHFYMLNDNNEYYEVTEIVIPDTITSIKECIFFGFNNVTKVVIPNNITSIEKNAFTGCTSLIDIEIPNSIKSIGNYAFSGCTSLISIVLPNSLEAIGEFAFSSCTNLKNIEFQQGTLLKILERGIFNSCALEKIEIPSSIEKIANGAFRNCSSLKEIIFSEDGSLLSIDSYAFEGLTSLEKIVLPKTIEELGGYIFSECTSLKEIYISNNITDVKSSFDDCEDLEKVYFDGDITDWIKINYNDFWDVYKGEFELYLPNEEGVYELVTDLVIPEGIQILVNGSLINNLKNINSVTIPKGMVVEKAIFGTTKTINSLYYNGTVRDWLLNNTRENYYGSLEKIEHIYFKDLTGNYYEVTELVIPSGIEKISYRAFYGMKNLKKVVISSSVTSIEPYAFCYCTNLEEVVFEENSSLKNLAGYAFRECTNLRNIVLPDSLENINWEAFQQCSSLYYINIPQNLKNVSNSYTYGVQLKGIYNPYNVSTDILGDIVNYLTVVCNRKVSDFIVVDEDGYVFINDGYQYVLIDYLGEGGEITLPSFVKGQTYYVKSSVFKGREDITKVVLPKTVTKYGYLLFERCANLKEVVIPKTLKEIPEGMFYGCKSLESVVISEDSMLEIIGDDAFWGCENLREFVLPKNLKEIGVAAFSDCNKLRVIYNFSTYEVKIGASFQAGYLSHYVDVICTSYNDEGYMETDDGFVFLKLDGEYILIDYRGTSTEVSLPRDFRGNSYKIEKPILSGNQAIETVYIPNTITELNHAFFENCANLKKIVFETGSSITKFGSYTFINCKSLKEVILPEGLIDLGEYTFQGCQSLETIDLPESLEIIRTSAFYNCTSLKEIIIPNNVNTMYVYVFSECTSLEKVKLPDNLKDINYSLFRNCSSLTNIELPNGLEEIDDYAFSGCTGLKSIVIPNTVTSLGMECFKDCTNLEYVNMSDGLTEGAQALFSGCTSLVEIVFPQNIEYISGSMFRGCTSLTEIILPSTVTSIGWNAFSGCTNLSNVVISQNVKTIGEKAFINCTNLNSIVIPNSVKVINNLGITDKDSINLYYDGTLEEWFKVDVEAQLIDSFNVNHHFYIKNENNEYIELLELILPNGIEALKKNNLSVFKNVNKLVISKDVKAFSASTLDVLPNLKELEVVEDNEYITMVDGNLYTKNLSELIRYFDKEDVKTFVIPEEVREIESYAFKGNQYLEEITIQHKVYYINSNAFEKDNNILFKVYRDTYAFDRVKDLKFRYEFIKSSDEIGDIDGSLGITINDAVYMLYHTMFGQKSYPVNQRLDFNDDGTPDVNDAVYMLYNVLFGEEQYPLY
ncbi:MAG: leucine-rich repeat protein [Bacilli bacterium]|nr:leucine-rich repeat protein [Bacilli bacterium]